MGADPAAHLEKLNRLAMAGAIACRLTSLRGDAARSTGQRRALVNTLLGAAAASIPSPGEAGRGGCAKQEVTRFMHRHSQLPQRDCAGAAACVDGRLADCFAPRPLICF